MIIEGLITTSNPDGNINVAPMGPIVDENMTSVLLRPWQGSTTYSNLCSTDFAVFHLVDDVDLIAEAAIRRLNHQPSMVAASVIKGRVLENCCRWLELKIISRDLSHERAEIQAQVVHDEHRRPFSGFNRAKHAILEAAILATRVHLLEETTVMQQMDWLSSAVEKTGTDKHQQLFQMLMDEIQDRFRSKVSCHAS